MLIDPSLIKPMSHEFQVIAKVDWMRSSHVFAELQIGALRPIWEQDTATETGDILSARCKSIGAVLLVEKVQPGLIDLAAAKILIG